MRTPTAFQVLRDAFRPKCWEHQGLLGPHYHAHEPSRWPWLSRFRWKANLYPWFGGDEWCRWTLVWPLIFTSLVIPLWGCRNPECVACEQDCVRRGGNND